MLEAKSGLKICKKIIPPTVIIPPRPFHLKAINKPIIVLMGNNNNAITSELFIAIILEPENNSPIVINNRNRITIAPSILADQRIIFKPFCFFKIVVS